jgi:hypothetical protein
MRKLVAIIAGSAVLLSLSSFVYADLNQTQTDLSHEAVKALFLEKCNQTGPGLDQFCDCFANQMEKYIDDTALSKCDNNKECTAQVYANAMDQAKASVAQCENLLPEAAIPSAATGGGMPAPVPPGN